MKHAILILAHNNFSVITALLQQLDTEEIDIYIHINKKVKNYPKFEWISQMKYAKLYFVKRFKISYCNYTMVRGVVSLLKESSKRKYDYYHLISGSDLLIKKQKDFLNFFDNNAGKEFVSFCYKYTDDKVKYKNYFISLGRQKSKTLSLTFIYIRRILINIQRKLKIQNKKITCYEVKKGADWYSITHSAVEYLLKEEPKFKKAFYRAYCPTEFFAATILYNSPFKNSFYGLEMENDNDQCLRHIDWDRGLPYTYTIEDKEILLNSKAMFARKFDENKDMEIVEFLRDYAISDNKK